MAYTERWENREREGYTDLPEDWDEEWEEAWEEPPRRQAGRRRRRSSGLRYGLNLVVVVLMIGLSAALCLGRILSGPVQEKQGDVTTGGGEYTPPAISEDTDQQDQNAQMLQEILNHPEVYPQDLQELAQKNPEALEYVYQYPQLRDQTPEIDLSAEAASGEIPLLLQWDARWGYQSYGSGLIGYTGCGPTCLSMVALYLTGDAKWDPATIADYAEQEGYYVDGSGTSWDMMTEGCRHFGLEAQEVGLDEGEMASALEEGKPLICVLGPGDFTDSGHFVVVTGHTDEGFRLHDPNSPQRSAQIWSFARLSSQIKNVWAYSKL